jgi:serine/threonine-protein kinase
MARRYERVDRLASGGMGELFVVRRAEATGFERLFVCKQLRRELVGDERAALLLCAEARIAAALHHRNIAQLIDVELVDGELGLIIEYVPGVDLAQLLDVHGALPLDLAATIVVEIAGGLHHAHQRTDDAGQPLGIVHRDVSLPNVLLGDQGEIKLTDFGVAKARSRLYTTQSNTIKGKLGYMAPEQVQGRAVDHRADVFALGVVLYEATTGLPLFTAPTEYETMDRVLAGQVPTPTLARYPASLLAIIRRAVAVDPAGRFASTAALADAVRTVAAEHRWPLSRRRVGELVRQALPATGEPWQRAGRADTTDDTEVRWGHA